MRFLETFKKNENILKFKILFKKKRILFSETVFHMFLVSIAYVFLVWKKDQNGRCPDSACDE